MNRSVTIDMQGMSNSVKSDILSYQSDTYGKFTSKMYMGPGIKHLANTSLTF